MVDLRLPFGELDFFLGGGACDFCGSNWLKCLFSEEKIKFLCGKRFSVNISFSFLVK